MDIDAISNEKCKGKNGHQGQAEVESFDDIRNQRTENIGEKGNDKKGQHHDTDHVIASFHAKSLEEGRMVKDTQSYLKISKSAKSVRAIDG